MFLSKIENISPDELCRVCKKNLIHDHDVCTRPIAIVKPMIRQTVAPPQQQQQRRQQRFLPFSSPFTRENIEQFMIGSSEKAHQWVADVCTWSLMSNSYQCVPSNGRQVYLHVYILYKKTRILFEGKIISLHAYKNINFMYLM